MKRVLDNLRSNWITYGFETLVVIVGILGAFGLNNWKEEKKSKNLEIQYLKRLHGDLVNDTAYYQKRIVYANEGFVNHKKYVKRSFEVLSKSEFIDIYNDLRLSSEALSIRETTYQEMVNAGQLSIFRNESLKISIIELYRQVEIAKQHFDEINHASAQLLIDFNIKTTTFKFLRFDETPWTEDMLEDDWQWINDPSSLNFKLFNQVMGYYSFKQTLFKGYLEDLRLRTTVLMKELESELLSRNHQVESPRIEDTYIVN